MHLIKRSCACQQINYIQRSWLTPTKKEGLAANARDHRQAQDGWKRLGLSVIGKKALQLDLGQGALGQKDVDCI
jgi:hypothetical protein